MEGNFKTGRLLFLVFSILTIVLLLVFNNVFLKKNYLKNKYVSEELVEKIKSTHKEYSNKIDLYYNGKIIPYSYYDDFYLLNVKEKNDYKNIYTIPNFQLGMINKENDYTIKLFVYNDKYYKELTLNLTNIPVINIDNKNNINLLGFNIKLSNLRCEYQIRGDLSLNSNKKSYKLNLKNTRNQNISIPLLGMNSSSSWILNSIYFDNSYMREKIGYDVWNNLSSNFNHKLEYVELIINNNYQGIYYLTEKVTMETFDGNPKKDLLVSIKTWDTALHALNKSNSLLINDDLMTEFEIEEGLEYDYDKQMKILELFRQSVLSNKTAFDIKYDLENMVDYKLFLNFTMARDNTYKNQKLIFKNMKSYYLVQKTIWDLDWTFNNENIYQMGSSINMDINDIDADLAISEELKNSLEYKELAKNKYIKFKKDYFNEENMLNIISHYRDYLESYGAVFRDTKRWNNEKYTESINTIKKFINDRIKVLDKYYGVL